MARSHLIGLLLASEEDWPSAFENVLRRLGPVTYRGEKHEFLSERVMNEPFDLRYQPGYALVIDRLSWWYDVPREWLKKIALMNDVYLLNSPFTFQSMEKHSAYCAGIRLGLKVPETWLIPHRVPPDNPRYLPVAERYSTAFDLDQIAGYLGYPLFMKPFDGGMWVGVTRITNPEELRFTYDHSGERLMHLQAAVDGYEVFTRTLSIGPQTMVMRYDPSAHGHYRYVAGHDFSPELERELAAISRLVNAFFRWEFNSCEAAVKDGHAYPIDYANASPDIALVSLHYYFPWAIESLVAWCIFCSVTERASLRLAPITRDYFQVGDDESLAYEQKIERYRQLTDIYFQTEEFEEFRAQVLPHLHELMVEYVESPEFDQLLVSCIRLEVEPERHDEMIERCRELTAAWAADQRAEAR